MIRRRASDHTPASILQEIVLTQRAELSSVLQAWLAGESTPEAVWHWAVAQQADKDHEDELVRDCVDTLSSLPYDLIVPEDAQIMLYGLGNPPEEADLAVNLLWNHLDGLDTQARRDALRDDPFYGPYCSDVY